MDDAKETARMEAFSDGVIAIVITLLAFEIKVPQVESGQTLVDALLSRWAVYLAFLISFLSLLIMWINHHDIMRLIRRVDRIFMVLNGFLLLCITLVPFSTLLLADYLQESQALTAAVVFNGNYVITALAFNVLWRYAIQADLLHPHVQQEAERISQQYRFGPLFYFLALGVAVLNVPLSLGVNLILALFFLVPPKFLQG